MEKEIFKQRDEMIRQFVELAIRCGRARWSDQTNFLQHYYHTAAEEKHDSIPVIENALFAFALFQSRTSENILEAKTLLSKLLFFQSSNGNFPIYLHEYPECKDRFLGVGLLPVFYWILKLFPQILGSELKKRLEYSLETLLAYCLHEQQLNKAPYHLAIKIAATAHAMERAEGLSLLSNLQAPEDKTLWSNPSSLGDILIALQMIYPNISDSPWNDFWNYLTQTWHISSLCYIGPPIKEQQEGFEPQPTLYDLFMGYFTNKLAKRALSDHIFHLQAPLIRPSGDLLSPPPYPFQVSGQLGERSWHLYQAETFAYGLLEKKGIINPSKEHSQHILRIVWGDANRAHTFVCQGGNFELSTFQVHPDRIDIYFDLTKAPIIGDREKSGEILFFCDVQEKMQVSVNEIRANTFQLGDWVELSSGIKFQFSLEKGKGNFFGHVMRGNRPAQLPLKGSKRFDAYDWKFFLRTIRWEEPCQLKASLKINMPHE